MVSGCHVKRLNFPINLSEAIRRKYTRFLPLQKYAKPTTNVDIQTEPTAINKLFPRHLTPFHKICKHKNDEHDNPHLLREL